MYDYIMLRNSPPRCIHTPVQKVAVIFVIYQKSPQKKKTGWAEVCMFTGCRRGSLLMLRYVVEGVNVASNNLCKHYWTILVAASNVLES